MKIIEKKQNAYEIIIHVVSWLLIFVFPVLLTEWGNNVDWERYMRHSFCPLSIYFVLFYVNYLFFIPNLLFKNKPYYFFIAECLLLLFLAIALHFEQELLFDAPKEIFNRNVPPPPPRSAFLGRHFIVMCFVAGLSIVIRIALRWQSIEEKLVRIEREKMDSELKNLKNQINPHFLLNTLNNIYALIAFNTEKAQEAVQELAKLLRYVLYENQNFQVSLKKELEFINNYISLMRIRLPESVKVNVVLDAGKKTLYIAPLIFISLIENAFKHGISPTQESFIDIIIVGHEDGIIQCDISNSYYPKKSADKSGSGIGLKQVHRRLELAYPNKYEWNKGVHVDKNVYTSRLIIQTLNI